VRGNLNNIKPTRQSTEKAIKGLERAYKAGKITKAQFEGLVKGVRKRLARAGSQ
jgi:hypothetical protein